MLKLPLKNPILFTALMTFSFDVFTMEQKEESVEDYDLNNPFNDITVYEVTYPSYISAKNTQNYIEYIKYVGPYVGPNNLNCEFKRICRKYTNPELKINSRMVCVVEYSKTVHKIDSVWFSILKSDYENQKITLRADETYVTYAMPTEDGTMVCSYNRNDKTINCYIEESKHKTRRSIDEQWFGILKGGYISNKKNKLQEIKSELC